MSPTMQIDLGDDKPGSLSFGLSGDEILAVECGGRYYDISADGYSFTLDRSYDGGTQWIRPIVSYRATRRRAAG
jgi:hypothetical protein